MNDILSMIKDKGFGIKSQLFVIATAVLLLLVSTSCVHAEDYPILDKQVEVRQAHLDWRTKVQQVGMEAVIEYIGGISNGTGTSKLSSLLEDFKSKTEEMDSLTTHIALNNELRQLKQITSQFRQETRSQLVSNHGKAGELVAQVKLALEESSDEINSLKDKYWEIRKENELAIFDLRLDRARTILDKLEENGYDVAAAQDKLAEIEAMRADLESALDSQDNMQILSVHASILKLSKELAEIVRDLQVEIPEDAKVRHWIRVGERVLERTETIISELEMIGMDVSELKEIHQKAGDELSDAQSKFDEGDIDGAKESLENLRQYFDELRNTYIELLSGESEVEISDELVAKIENTESALKETVEEMEGEL